MKWILLKSNFSNQKLKLDRNSSSAKHRPNIAVRLIKRRFEMQIREGQTQLNAI